MTESHLSLLTQISGSLGGAFGHSDWSPTDPSNLCSNPIEFLWCTLRIGLIKPKHGGGGDTSMEDI